jgi:hypothetical protein
LFGDVLDVEFFAQAGDDHTHGAAGKGDGGQGGRSDGEI